MVAPTLVRKREAILARIRSDIIAPPMYPYPKAVRLRDPDPVVVK
jgi:hypothetical protein